MDDQEALEIMRRLTGEAGFTADELKRLADNASGAGKKLDFLGSTVSKLTRGALAYGEAMVQGQRGAGAFNRTIDLSASAASELASQFGAMGKAIGLAIQAVGGYVKAVNQLSDNLYTSYTRLSKTGISAADGMTGLAQASVDLGFGLSQIGLEDFTRLMTKASHDLALLSGSAVDGRRSMASFGKLLADRGPVQRALGNLGYQVEDIAEMSAGYIKQEVAMGRGRLRSDRDLAESTQRYIMQLDILSKLTGKSVEEVQNQMDADLRNQRFQAALLRVEREQGKDAADRLRQNMAVASLMFPDIAEGLKDISSGYVQTEAARRAFMAGMERIPEMMTQDNAQWMTAMGRSAKDLTTSMGETLGSVGVFNDVFGALNEMVKAGNLSQRDAEAIRQKLIDQQQRQIAGEDGLVDAATGLRIEQMKGRDSLQNLIMFGVNPVTKAMIGLAGAVNYLIAPLEMIAKLFGYKPSGTGATTKTGSATVGRSAAAVAGAIGGAKLGAAGGIPGMLAGGTLGGLTGLFSWDASGVGKSAAVMNPDDVISFQGGVTGNRSNFERLDPEFRERILAMASEYMNQTGQKLPITSAARNEEEQQKLRAQGYKVAEHSRHREGRAVDVPVSVRQFLEGSGILQKHNLTGISQSPSHIQSLAQGGIATGPKSGYMAQLHGTEAVVPLPDNRSIPVEMPDFSGSFDRQIDMMAQQITRLDDLVNLMRNQTSISHQILQAQNN